MVNEEEEIKKKILQQRLSQMSLEQQIQLQQAEEALKSAMVKILTKEARERLNNLKLVKPDLAVQLQIYLFQLYQAGQIKEPITDAQLKEILKRMGAKRDFKIIRK